MPIRTGFIIGQYLQKYNSDYLKKAFNMSKGSLSCVGVGMTLGAHISPLAKSYITNADVLFIGVSDGIVERWLMEMHPEARSLQVYYQEGKSRQLTYKEMVNAMMEEVRKGRKVCGAFYGHPGVFALPPHKAIDCARSEGYAAVMVPGISAEDCLFADLGIDPGRVGCIHYEASQFIFYQRKVDPSAYLILWQIGIVGDNSLSKYSTGAEYRSILLDILSEDYSLEHSVILYEAPTLPIHAPRMEKITLKDLLNAELKLITTLVIPPSTGMIRNESVMRKIKALPI